MVTYSHNTWKIGRGSWESERGAGLDWAGKADGKLCLRGDLTWRRKWPPEGSKPRRRKQVGARENQGTSWQPQLVSCYFRVVEHATLGLVLLVCPVDCNKIIALTYPTGLARPPNTNPPNTNLEATTGWELKEAESKNFSEEALTRLCTHSLALSPPQKEEERCLTPSPCWDLVWGLPGMSLWTGVWLSWSISRERPGLSCAKEWHSEEGSEQHWKWIVLSHSRDVGEVPTHHTWASWEPGWSHLQRDLA